MNVKQAYEDLEFLETLTRIAKGRDEAMKAEAEAFLPVLREWISNHQTHSDLLSTIALKPSTPPEVIVTPGAPTSDHSDADAIDVGAIFWEGLREIQARYKI